VAGAPPTALRSVLNPSNIHDPPPLVTSPLSVTQIVTGSGNVFTGTGDVVYVTPNPPPPSVEERHNLLNLAAQVRQVWIRDVLEDSVHHAALLDLGMRTEPGAVEHPWERVLIKADEPSRVLPRETGIGEVFESVGRMLLILGAPGSGKTTTLLTLAHECLDHAECNPAAPVPLVLNLSQWARSRRPIHLWLESELKQRHHTGRRFARRWLKGHHLFLFLDGLDEVVPEQRAACVAALNAYVETFGVAGMVVCCRSEDYRRLGVRLPVSGAVELLPLSQAHIERYLDAAGGRLDGLRAALAANETLRQLAETPVMLSVMTFAARDAPASALRFDDASDFEELRGQIFALYVNQMFRRRGQDNRGFPHDRTTWWLNWLARSMSHRGESDFAIELLQPAWLTRGHLMLYALMSRVFATMVVSVCTGTQLWLFFTPFILGVGDNPLVQSNPVTAMLVFLANSIVFGAFLGSLYGCIDLVRFLLPHQGENPPVLRFFMKLGLALAYSFLALLVWIVQVLVLTGGESTPESRVIMIGLMWILLSLPLLILFIGILPGRGEPERDISVVGALVWNWAGAVKGLVSGIAVASLLALIELLVAMERADKVVLMLIVAIGAMFGIGYGGWRRELPPLGAWNRRSISIVRNSIRATVVLLFGWSALGVMVGILMGAKSNDVFLTSWIVAVMGVSPAVIWYRGLDGLLHAALRLVLCGAGVLPLRLRAFLDYAVHLGFLQHAGGGYRFLHAYLQHHFASDTRFTYTSAPTTRVHAHSQ